jgi:hypothetical protein
LPGLNVKDFLACPRVASLAGGAALHFENAEVPQFNAVILHERFDDGVERLLDDLFGL